MQDIYSISYDVFMLFLNKITDRYGENRKVLKTIIIDVLTNEKSIFNEDLKSFIDDAINLDTCKRVIMFMLVSKSYVMNYYDFVHEINRAYTEDMIQELESLNKENVIELFYKPSEVTDDILEDFFAYIVRPYVFQSKAKELVFKDGKLKTLLELNPFEALDIWDYISDEDFMESEKYIQTFFNLYDKSISDASLDEFGEKENYDEADDYEYSLFINNIRNHFEDDSTKILLFLSYIMSNIYEFLVVEKKNNPKEYEDAFYLIDYFENEDIYTLKDEFLTNQDFALRIIDLFVEINGTLYEDDLLNRRDDFKKCGDVKLLRKLNPYFDAEEIVYKEIKETSTLN